MGQKSVKWMPTWSINTNREDTWTNQIVMRTTNIQSYVNLKINYTQDLSYNKVTEEKLILPNFGNDTKQFINQ